jgi:predicted RNase H-like HicB family nuclease
MKDSDQYLKIVKWSDEDECYVGTSPGLFYGGCHGADKAEVYAELCQIIDEWLEILKQDGKPLPPPNAG